MNQENQYEFYTITSKGWEAMLSACRSATQTILIEQYIFDVDKIGTEFINILKEKSKNGVKVRLLLDMVGSWGFYNSEVLEEIRKLGIEVRFFNIVSPWRVHNFTSWIFRNHRKTLIVDGKVGFTGGIGIGDYMADWRDTSFKIMGMPVEEMQISFEELWIASEKDTLSSRLRIFRSDIKRKFFITSAPYFKKRFLYYVLIEAIRSAKKSIYLTNPYFIPSRRLTRVLRLAVRRGVDVRVLVPDVRDVPLVHTASESMYTYFLKHGVRIFRYKPVFHHGKTAVVDGEWATAGSLNLDNQSFKYNFEANIVTTDKDFVRAIDAHFAEDLKESYEVTYEEWQKRSLISKIKEFFTAPIRGFL